VQLSPWSKALYPFASNFGYLLSLAVSNVVYQHMVRLNQVATQSGTAQRMCRVGVATPGTTF
jgi:hypothetical protein